MEVLFANEIKDVESQISVPTCTLVPEERKVGGRHIMDRRDLSHNEA